MSLREYLVERIAALREENNKLSERIESGKTWFPDLVENRITSKGERITELEQALAKLDESIKQIEELMNNPTTGREGLKTSGDFIAGRFDFYLIVLKILRGKK